MNLTDLESAMPLEQTLQYDFKDKNLLAQALSHPSRSSEIRPAPPDNQRLEFLGDAILDLIISEELYRRHPDHKEGQLSKTRASIVSRNALAAIARRLELGPRLLMGRGEESSGGRERDSILADAVEAVIAAIYLDADFVTVTKIVLKIFAPELDDQHSDINHDNPKGSLQEAVQGISNDWPIYRIVSEDGPDHRRIYQAEVHWMGQKLGSGEGNSKKNAEIAAAQQALRHRLWLKKNR